MVRFLGVASLVLFLQIALVFAMDYEIQRVGTTRRSGSQSGCASGGCE